MKTVTREFKVFTFAELSEEAREKVLMDMCDLNVDYDWWGCTYEDAQIIGCKISSFDTGRANSIEFELLTGIEDCYNLIKKNHGEACNTYLIALDIETKHTNLLTDTLLSDNTFSDGIDNLEEDFRQRLGEEYLSMLCKEYEYSTSNKAIIETIESNDYEFLEDGKLF